MQISFEKIFKSLSSKSFFVYIASLVLLSVLLNSCGLSPRSPSPDASKDSKEQISSNPYDIIHFDEDLAIIVRYGSPYLWFVDTSVTQENEKEFRKSKFNFSSYDDDDGIPEIMGGVAVSYSSQYTGDAEYIVLGLQRLFRNTNSNSWELNKSAYLIVLNQDGTEYDTGLGDGDLKGIKLRVKNPYRRLFYDKYHNYIYVAGAGSLVSNNETGGIDRVKLNNDGSFSFDDDPNGDSQNEYPLNKGHSITDIVVFSDNTGAFVEYTEWGNTCLRSFDAENGSFSNTSCKANLGGAGVNIYALETWKNASTGDEYLFVATSVTDKDIDGGDDENGGYLFILDTSFNIVKKISMPSAMNPTDITLQYDLNNADNYLRVTVALSSRDWSSGGLALINCDNGISECAFLPSNLLNATISDLAVISYNKNFYLLERYQKDTISKFNIDNTDLGDYTPTWQFSTNE